MELLYMYSLYNCNHIVCITYIAMYVSISPSMIYILNSGQIGRDKLVLFIKPIFLLVRGALVELPVDWERNKILFGLVKLSQGHVFFLEIWLIFPFLEKSWRSSNKCHGKVSPCHQCNMPVSFGGPIKHARDDQPFSLNWWQHITQVVLILSSFPQPLQM